MPPPLRNVAIVGVAALALGSVISVEWTMSGPSGTPPPTMPAPAAKRTEPSAPAVPGLEQMQAWVDALRARPLFAQDRRPAKLDAAAAPASVELPRLAGVMVSAQGGNAIFAAAAGGKAVVIGAGASIGGFTVQKIEAGQVTLVDADGGIHLLRPSFDPKLVPTRADSAAPRSPAAGTVATPRPRPALVTRSAPAGTGVPRQLRPGGAQPR